MFDSAARNSKKVGRTLGGDGQLVSRGIVEERLLDEKVVASLGVVCQSNLDLAVLNVRQLDGEGSIPLGEIDSRSADGGRQDGKAGNRVLHVGMIERFERTE